MHSRVDRVDYVCGTGDIQICLRWHDLWASIRGPGVPVVRELLQRLRGSQDERPGGRTWLDRGSELLVLRGLLPKILTDGRETPGAGMAAERLRVAGLLRDYQAKAVMKALEAPWGCGILWVPMGGGKTRISAAIAAVGASLGLPRWLVLSPNSELARQASREFAVRLPELAEVLSSPVALVESTTYTRAGAAEVDGVIVDEVHRIAATTWSRAFASVRAGFRIGMSGTPLDRIDGNNGRVSALCGPVVCRVDMGMLQETGALAQGHVRRVTFNHRTGGLG